MRRSVEIPVLDDDVGEESVADDASDDHDEVEDGEAQVGVVVRVEALGGDSIENVLLEFRLEKWTELPI